MSHPETTAPDRHATVDCRATRPGTEYVVIVRRFNHPHLARGVERFIGRDLTYSQARALLLDLKGRFPGLFGPTSTTYLMIQPARNRSRERRAS